MYSKKILSTVAAVAVVSTGLMAFDTNTNQEIINEIGRAGQYTGGVSATEDLNLSLDQRGDALIFPYYSMAVDSRGKKWETEIVVRNTSPKATVAKVALYRKKDSRELVDFNIYLSPYDAMRFVIKDRNIYSIDGSVPMGSTQTNPIHGARADDADFADVDNREEFSVLGSDALSVLQRPDSDTGYVVVYGMTQYQDGDTLASAESDLNYHDNSLERKALHKELWKDYRRLLDDCRPNWRASYGSNGSIGGFEDGMMTVVVPAPDTNVGCATTSDSVLADEGYELENFGDVDTNTLVGTVRISQADGVQSRDLLLPATALANLTKDNMILWSEGEYAALHDRRIVNGKYDENGVRADARAFLIKSAYYTYSKDSKANQLLITQPMKRVLTQLGNDDGYWQNITNENPYGGFKIAGNTFDEDETIDGESINITRGTFTSPFNTTGFVDSTYNDELHILANLEEDEQIVHDTDYFGNNDGFMYITFQGNTEGLPAIVTQMTGSKIDHIAQTNWIYAPTIK
jgi:hypothetical protein